MLSSPLQNSRKLVNALIARKMIICIQVAPIISCYQESVEKSSVSKSVSYSPESGPKYSGSAKSVSYLLEIG